MEFKSGWLKEKCNKMSEGITRAAYKIEER